MFSRWISVSVLCASRLHYFASFQYISHIILCRYFLELLPLLVQLPAYSHSHSWHIVSPFSLVPCPFVDFATFTHLLHFVGLRIDVVAAVAAATIVTVALLVCYLALQCCYSFLFLAPVRFRFAVCRRNVKRKFTTHFARYIFTSRFFSFCSAVITRTRWIPS